MNQLARQRDATIYWKQELEEAHVSCSLYPFSLVLKTCYFQERIQALTHQNSELRKRVVWNLSQNPTRNGRKQTHDEENGEGLRSHSDTGK